MNDMDIKSEILHYSRQNNQWPLDYWFSSYLDELIADETFASPSHVEYVGERLILSLFDYRRRFNIDTVVIGMSGGVDSALTAALFKAAEWRVLGVTMPIHQDPVETDRGIEACEVLGIDHKHVDLTNLYDATITSIAEHDTKITDTLEALRRGNIRARLRMMTLYNEAQTRRGLVASTDNFSELATGFWTLHGDVGDLAPIQSLFKSWEVPRLAQIHNIPESTVLATPTDGLGISRGDETQFGFSYLELDILLALLARREQWTSRDHILSVLLPPDNCIDKVNRILDRIKNSAFKRKNPYNLGHPDHPGRYLSLAGVDHTLWWKPKK